MATPTTPTVKNVLILNTDYYRQAILIAWLISRGMLDAPSQSFIIRGRR